MFEEQKFIPDFGYDAPEKIGEKDCPFPSFADHSLHRIGIFKIEHFGASGDRDENGLPGWVVHKKCVNCGKEKRAKLFMPTVI